MRRLRDVLDFALAYLDAGISVIPIARDGAKRPDGELLPRVFDEDRGTYRHSWKPFQEARVTPEKARDWWRPIGPEPGVAAICGAVSGNLEVIDFDRQVDEVHPAWMQLVHEEDKTLLPRLTQVMTPGKAEPGYHWWFRCPEAGTPGSQKLAVDVTAAAKDRTLVETRGEGGYALAPGTPGACHPSGGVYRHVGGPPLHEVGDVTAAERELLLRCARLFDTEAQEERPPAGGDHGDLLPGADYDLRGPAWDEILAPHGWERVAKGSGSELRWKRPGKDAPGWSATTGFCRGKDGADLLRVFSSNAAPFQDGKAYGKFRALSLLEHGGDWAAAARRLSRMGFGSPARRGVSRASWERSALPAKPSRQEIERVLAALADADPEDVLAALEPALARAGLAAGEGARHG